MASHLPPPANLFGSRITQRLYNSTAPPSPDFLGKPDKKSFRPADVAETIHVLILDHFAHELRATLLEARQHVINIIDGEHDT